MIRRHQAVALAPVLEVHQCTVHTRLILLPGQATRSLSCSSLLFAHSVPVNVRPCHPVDNPPPKCIVYSGFRRGLAEHVPATSFVYTPPILKLVGPSLCYSILTYL